MSKSLPNYWYLNNTNAAQDTPATKLPTLAPKTFHHITFKYIQTTARTAATIYLPESARGRDKARNENKEDTRARMLIYTVQRFNEPKQQDVPLLLRAGIEDRYRKRSSPRPPKIAARRKVEITIPTLSFSLAHSTSINIHIGQRTCQINFPENQPICYSDQIYNNSA